jgi:hypothetical protein
MAVYCEMRTDEEILRDIGEADRVLLVGCPVCPNFSCVVHQKEDGPVEKLGVKGIKPLLLEKEMNKTAGWLQDKGVSADAWTLPGMPASFCAISDSTRKKLSEKAQDRDAVVVFSCESGHKCVEGIVPEKRVVAAMNATGLLRVVTSRKGRKFFVDRDSAQIIKFTLE